MNKPFTMVTLTPLLSQDQAAMNLPPRAPGDQVMIRAYPMRYEREGDPDPAAVMACFEKKRANFVERVKASDGPARAARFLLPDFVLVRGHWTAEQLGPHARVLLAKRGKSEIVELEPSRPVARGRF